MNPNVFPKTHEMVDLTPLITRTLSFFLDICYLALEILVFSLLSKNKSEAPFSSFKHKINEVTQKIMADEAKINEGYLSVKERKERWKAFKRIENLTALEGYDNWKEEILPKIVSSQ